MRPIKFRAWNKIGKKMWEPIVAPNNKLIPLMQYTGMIDVKGKEIYENDLVRWNDQILQVVFKDGCFICQDRNGSKPRYIIIINKTVEVIGHIYEEETLK